ncbi:MAG: HAMP domain-containing sensor histidine kinase [Acidimicrobiia bacterium]
MSLRTRLVISFTVLLLGVLVAVGLVASRSIHGILVDQIGKTLRSAVEHGPGTGSGPFGSNQDQDQNQLLNPLAEIWVAPDGTIVRARPSGFVDDPDPLPDVSGLLNTQNGFVDLASTDGSLQYRAYVQHVFGGAIVRAVPLSDVATATAALIRALLLAGGGLLLLGGAATWWTVHGAMRSVGEMVDTAEAIAAGDLSRRVPDLQSGTELGRLGLSLNEMLGHLENAFETEREGKERLRQFAADASHELRTPLTAIFGYAQLRKRGGLSTPEAEDKAWDRIESESLRMASLVEDLLTLARLGQSTPLQLGDVDLAAVVRNAAADHAAMDPDRPVSVEAPDRVVVQGDEHQLTQVVASLLSNTRVHTPAGTKMEISVVDGAENVEVVAEDDGPGIPEAAMEHIFDRFYRADPSRSRASGGAGLGLSIVRAIVEAHGGTVSVDAADTGGTRITIELPKHQTA